MSLELVVDGGTVHATREAATSSSCEAEDGALTGACDLVHVPPGESLETTGVRRALLFTSEGHDVEAPPGSWDALPSSLFAPVEDAPRGTLPVSCGGLVVSAVDRELVFVAVGTGTAQVPRYWLARMLFRVGLHRPLLGYVETYGGFFFDDREPGRHRIGVRGLGEIALPPDDSLRLVESHYRAVAPDGYSERLDA